MFYSDDPARDWDRYCEYLAERERERLAEIDGTYISSSQEFELKIIKNKEKENIYDIFIYDKKYLEVSKEELESSLEEYAFLIFKNDNLLVNFKSVYFSYKLNVYSEDEFAADDVDEIYSEDMIILNNEYKVPEYDFNSMIGFAAFEKICMKAIEQYIILDYDGIYDDVVAK